MKLNYENWDASVELITPSSAKKMLEKNSENRNLKKSTVKKYATIMQAGKWLTTPEAICFRSDGVLMNGQHRLNAVILSGCQQEFLVIRNVGQDVFKALDRGAIRTASDALGIDRLLAEAARTGAVLISGSASKGIPDHMVMDVATIISDAHDMVTQACGKKVKFFSSAAFRLAACLRLMIDKDEQFILDQYKAMVLIDMNSMCNSAKALSSAVYSGRVNTSASNQYDVFRRAWYVLNKENKDKTRMSISDHDTSISEAVALLTT